MKRFLITSLWCLLGATVLLGQDEIVVTSSSSAHPYERPQWTKAQGVAWLAKYGPIIGVNHPMEPYPGMSRRECLRKVKELGFNSVRYFVPGNTAEDYIRNLSSWADDCEDFGLSLAPVFTFPHVCYYDMGDRDKGFRLCEEIVREVIRTFRGDRRIIMWDVWNEPPIGSVHSMPIMDWIEKMVIWCRQEGSTQPITSSIIFDTGIAGAYQGPENVEHTRRQEVEAMMDLHNFHDYTVEEDHGRNVPILVERLRKLGDRPMVATEALTRTNGSGVARSLCEFARYGIGFYVWGLYSCDANWEVKWYRSTYYAWEPMFHNMLYADGDPYDERELDWIRDFHFAREGETTDPGAEFTEVWPLRRAWKWMNRDTPRGVHFTSVKEALDALSEAKKEKAGNCVSVDLNIKDYYADKDEFYALLDSLLSTAHEGGMTVLPTVLCGTDLGRVPSTVQAYVFDVIGRYYSDRRIIGWNVFRQTNETNVSQAMSRLPALMRYVRYDFPNQPLMLMPLVDENVKADQASTDLANLCWRMSDAIGYATDDEALSTQWHTELYDVYPRPQFQLPATETLSSPLLPLSVGQDRWPGWKTWQWMNRTATKGLYYASVAEALRGIESHRREDGYNSLCVPLDYATYRQNRETFFLETDSLMHAASNAGMTVLPTLLTSKLLDSEPEGNMTEYVSDVLSRYTDSLQVLAWDLCYKPTNNRASAVLPTLFAAARAVGPKQPLFATPAVTVQTLPDNYIEILQHLNEAAGWDRLSYPSGASADLCYQIWCMSDFIAYSFQTLTTESSQIGWLTSVAYRFGRPLVCTQWRASPIKPAASVLEIFSDMHVNWYVDGEKYLAEELVDKFTFRPISTEH